MDEELIVPITKQETTAHARVVYVVCAHAHDCR